MNNLRWYVVDIRVAMLAAGEAHDAEGFHLERGLLGEGFGWKCSKMKHFPSGLSLASGFWMA
jgi:hypothetical protein